MNKFNKYNFIDQLKADIKSEKLDSDNVWDFICQEIDRECIYYYNCFEIVKELDVTDWSDMEGRGDCGHITDITQLAAFALTDYVVENLDLN
tara:strand:- start:619 stop:894 length:276 start_codon:yes stop_codon:yes gene_type:complete